MLKFKTSFALQHTLKRQVHNIGVLAECFGDTRRSQSQGTHFNYCKSEGSCHKTEALLL